MKNIEDLRVQSETTRFMKKNWSNQYLEYLVNENMLLSFYILGTMAGNRTLPCRRNKAERLLYSINESTYTNMVYSFQSHASSEQLEVVISILTKKQYNNW